MINIVAGLVGTVSSRILFRLDSQHFGEEETSLDLLIAEHIVFVSVEFIEVGEQLIDRLASVELAIVVLVEVFKDRLGARHELGPALAGDRFGSIRGGRDLWFGVGDFGDRLLLVGDVALVGTAGELRPLIKQRWVEGGGW